MKTNQQYFLSLASSLFLFSLLWDFMKDLEENILWKHPQDVKHLEEKWEEVQEGQPPLFSKSFSLSFLLLWELRTTKLNPRPALRIQELYSLKIYQIYQTSIKTSRRKNYKSRDEAWKTNYSFLSIFSLFPNLVFTLDLNNVDHDIIIFEVCWILAA